MAEHFEFLTRSEQVSKVVAQLLHEPQPIGLDTETTGLDCRRDRVTLLSISTQENTYVVDVRNTNLLEAFRPVLENENIPKIGANLSFDYQMIKGTAGIDTEGIWDLMLAEYALTAGTQFDGYGLDDISKKYLGISLDKSLQTSFVGHHGDFSQEQLSYAAKDTSNLIRLAKVMKDEMGRFGVLKAWKIESNAVPAFADMEFYGQKIDVAAWKELIQENQAAADKAKLELDSFFSQVTELDERGVPLINYNSRNQLLTGLQHLGLEVDGALITSTDKKVQKKLRDVPVIQALSRYRASVKRVGTYGDKYLRAIHPLTGRIHFSFRQYGTETGRPACRGGLNCLNIPRDKKYRKAFVTDPGRLISTVDYSAAELRILAELSGERLMIDGFNSGIDFHCYVASLVFKKEVTKKNENAYLRDPTKTLNFGWQIAA